MLHRRYILYFLLMVFSFTQLLPVYAAEDDSPKVEGAYPQTVGKAALLMDASSGRILYEVNSRQRLSPASVTKIMTALIVVEKGDLDLQIKISQTAVDTPESSIWLETGEKLTREQLLYACMLKSANDAAVALAESVAGSEKNFVALMNSRAAQLGMKDTHFCNPHGLENSAHYTTAYDLALVSREALKHKIFRQVVSTKTKTIPWADNDYDRLLINQNRLLYRYDDAVGIKTGYTKQAGNCVVGAAQKGDLLLIAVAMNSPSVYQDLAQMLDYGFANFHKETIKKSKDLSVVIPVENGQEKNVQARPKDDLNVAVTANEEAQLAYRVYPQSQVTAPVAKGQILGSCRIYVAGHEIGQMDMLASTSVAAKPPFLTRFKVVCITVLKIIAAVLIIFSGLYLIRLRNIRKQRHKRFYKL
ncbi:MAG: D-alanyl-D-alanine carboxypeptidase [Syntrophomonadaceae bacterium]|nr:D-alanyl-D-alanine carboxypeptidase [Syntrophomonadaceae bacterium]